MDNPVASAPPMSGPATGTHPRTSVSAEVKPRARIERGTRDGVRASGAGWTVEGQPRPTRGLLSVRLCGAA
jgi:hypothetical protein